MRIIDTIQRCVEETPWDEWIINNDKYLALFCIAVAVVGALYFGILGAIAIIRMGQ